MTEAAAPDLFQYPLGDFRWRLWLLIERIDEVFAAAQRAGMCYPSLRDPRGAWALEHNDRDPFAGAIWNIDQIMKPDHLPAPWPAMFLDEAEWCCQEAEQCVIDRHRSLRLRETPRWQELRERIRGLKDTKVAITLSLGGVQVHECPFDDELYARLRQKAIDCIEDDDLDAAERYCTANGVNPIPSRHCSPRLRLGQ